MIDAEKVWAAAFHDLDRRSIQEWAAENITLPPVLTRSGKFSTVGSAQFDGPLHALRSDRVRVVCVLAPPRGGKTLIADVAIPWAIVNDHASVLEVLQDDKIAPSHAETRAMPILRSVPAIASMLSIDRHKTRKADIIFGNGLPFIITGPALSNLQSRGFKWVVCDEAWMYKPGVLGQAEARLGDFEKMSSSKFLVLSQGGEEDSEWDFKCRSGVLFVWHVPCGGCGKQIAPEWTVRRANNALAGAVFDTMKNTDGSYDKEASSKTVRFVCPLCGHAHPNTAKTRAVWNIGGRYINPVSGEEFNKDSPPTNVTFRWHALIDSPWEKLVLEWLGAQEAKHVGNFAPLVNFLQKRCAEMRSERTVHDADLPFARVKIEGAWSEEKYRFMTVDRQSEDLYWVMVRSWAEKSGETRRLFYGKVYGEAAIEALRVEHKVATNCTVVDSGYMPKGDHGVYAACIRYGWLAAKGCEDFYFWHAIPQPPPRPPLRVMKAWATKSYGDPGEGTNEQGKRRVALWRFSSPTMKDRVHGLIKAGLWVEPDTTGDEMDKECAKQMAAEFKRAKVNRFTRKTENVWVCPSGNNHALDCSAMQILCAMQVGCIPAGVEMEKSENKKEPNS